jgi:hypothetical protein
MPNKRWNSMHGANDKSGGGYSNKAPGSKPNESMPEKTAAWPGLPGSAQGKDRSGGTPKKGPRGSFYVKQSGL